MDARRVMFGLLTVAGITAAAIAGNPIGRQGVAPGAPAADQPVAASARPVPARSLAGRAQLTKARQPGVIQSAMQRRSSSAASANAGATHVARGVRPANAMVAVAAKGVADGRPIVSPDVAQGVQKWVDRTLPGPNHEALGYFVGRWNAEVIYSNLPGAMSAGKDARTRGSVVTTWTHGKRFLRSEYTGGVGGPDFSATSTIGFNNAVGRFEGTWMDSTATGVRTSTGSVDATGKVFTLVSTFPDPINGSQTTFKEVLTINAPNRYTHQVFEVGRNRTEHRIREVVFTRAK